MSGSQVGLMVAVFLASAVEFVEAFTIVLAMGLTRGWRATRWGTPPRSRCWPLSPPWRGTRSSSGCRSRRSSWSIGTLLLIFGLQWLRKAILRSAGLKALHDEEQTFREEREAARAPRRDARSGWTGSASSSRSRACSSRASRWSSS